MTTRWILFVVVFISGNLFYTNVPAEDNIIILKKPPLSIENWYKPHNKRQVWLHTMFRLRRELLAINDYSQSQQAPLLKKWLKSFEKDYLEIGKMVPEWQEFIDNEKLNYLKTAVEKDNYAKIPELIADLNNSCDNCHTDYQAVTRILYRGADFAKIKVQHQGHKVPYTKAMGELSNAVNRIKIAIHDNAYQTAIDKIKPLQAQLNNLSDGCSDCHKQSQEQVNYIFNSVPTSLGKLKLAMENKDNKEARISLGTFAVNVCARCHSAHRTVSDIKELLE